LIDAINQKDRLLEKQEDTLYEEHDKCVNAEKSLAMEIKKNENLSSELYSCHESISILKDLSANLNTRIEKLNVASHHYSIFLFVIDVKTLILMLAIIMFLLSLS
jgi:hypothetical protein